LDHQDRLDPTRDGGELTQHAASKPLLGYADKFSVENGQAIAFKISAALAGTYHVEIVRLRCADHTGIGLQQTTVGTPATRSSPARFQPVYAGSYIDVEAAAAFALPR